MSNTTNIMIVGVGGQGNLLASRIFGNVLLQNGFDVKVSEVHGMSQRGGSVVTYVKYGEQVFSPTVEKGEADFIVAFEQLEAARHLSYLKKGGTMIASTQAIDPMPVITGAAEYPAGIFETIRGKGVNLITVDALSLALRAGNAKSVNVVLLGVLSRLLDFAPEVWEKALAECVKPQFLELNQTAFKLGSEFA